MQAKVLILLTAAAMAALTIYLGQRQASVSVAQAPLPTVLLQQAAVKSYTPVINRPQLSLHSPQGALDTRNLHAHSDHDETAIPADLAEQIEVRRIAVSELELKPVRNGYSMAAKGQHHTVVVAYIGADGKLHQTERQVQPIPDAPLVLPPPPANAPARP